jgi:hypothetical protein
MVKKYVLLTYSGDGLGRLLLPLSLQRRIIWTAIVVFLWYIMIRQSMDATRQYLQHPKSVSVEVHDGLICVTSIRHEEDEDNVYNCLYAGSR